MSKSEDGAVDESETDSERPTGNSGAFDGPPGPGASAVGVPGIIAITAYLSLLAIALIYALLVVWPTPTPSREDRPQAGASQSVNTADQITAAEPRSKSEGPQQRPSVPAAISVAANATESGSLQSPIRCSGEPCQVNLFGWNIWIWDEQRLLLIVVLAGALGSLIHALRSVYWYVGNRTLVRSWLGMYLLLPLAGGALGLVFYLVIRGGFFSPQSSFEQTSPFGFAAFAALIGMFSQQAVLKLQSVAETLLTKPEPGEDATPQNAEAPKSEE